MIEEYSDFLLFVGRLLKYGEKLVKKKRRKIYLYLHLDGMRRQICLWEPGENPGGPAKKFIAIDLCFGASNPTAKLKRHYRKQIRGAVEKW